MNSITPLKTVTLAAMALAVMLASTACQNSEAVESGTVVVPVGIEDSRLETIQETIQTKGIVHAVDIAYVSPKIPGKLSSLKVDVGDAVRAGQVVAMLDTTQIQLAVRQAEQALAQAKAGQAQAEAAVIQAEANYGKVEADYNRIKSLYEKNSVARQQYDHAATGLKMAEAAYNASKEQRKLAEAQKEAAEIQVEIAKTNLSDCSITAPITGVITERQKDIGEVVSGSPIFTIETTDNLEIKADVASIYGSRLTPGMPVVIDIEGQQDSIHVVIDEITPRINMANRSFEITCKLPAGLHLAPGYYASVSVVLAERQNAVTIPKDAVVVEGDATYVFRAHEDVAEKVLVRTGLSSKGRLEIVEGISAGDRIVVTGQNQLSNNAAILITGME